MTFDEKITRQKAAEVNKQRFLEIFHEKIHREGADKLLEFLEKSDFFSAPASTRYHGAYLGGLLEHSLNVYECLADLCARAKEKYNLEYSDETIAIVGLFHDICKVDFYKETFRNKKNEATGVWEREISYNIEDSLPYGHGEKSVYMLSGFIRLDREEAFAIRYHMGFSGSPDDKQNVSRAMELFPLALFTSFADSEAAFLIESRNENH